MTYNMMNKKIIIVLIFAVLGYVIVIGPDCIFFKYFNIICPGCGMTRAARELLKFDFKGAFRCHPMIYSMPVVFWGIVKNGKITRNKIINIIIFALIGSGFLINYLLKLRDFL